MVTVHVMVTVIKGKQVVTVHAMVTVIKGKQVRYSHRDKIEQLTSEKFLAMVAKITQMNW
jgi:hypothetical protein